MSTSDKFAFSLLKNDEVLSVKILDPKFEDDKVETAEDEDFGP